MLISWSICPRIFPRNAICFICAFYIFTISRILNLFISKWNFRCFYSKIFTLFWLHHTIISSSLKNLFYTSIFPKCLYHFGWSLPHYSKSMTNFNNLITDNRFEIHLHNKLFLIPIYIFPFLISYHCGINHYTNHKLLLVLNQNYLGSYQISKFQSHVLHHLKIILHKIIQFFSTNIYLYH